jgi:hypothetical protein
MNDRKFFKTFFISKGDSILLNNCKINGVLVFDIQNFEKYNNVSIKRNKYETEMFSGIIEIKKSPIERITLTINNGWIILCRFRKIRNTVEISESVIDFSNLFSNQIDYPIITTTLNNKTKKSITSKMYVTLEGTFIPIFKKFEKDFKTSTNNKFNHHLKSVICEKDTLSYFETSLNGTVLISLNNFDREKFNLEYRNNCCSNFTGVLSFRKHNSSKYLVLISEGYIQQIVYLKTKFKYYLDLTDYQYALNFDNILHPQRVILFNNELKETSSVNNNYLGETILINP